MAMKRQMERREEKEEKKKKEKPPEVKRDLPNGVMAISPKSARDSSNAEGTIAKKVGLGLDEGCGLRRRFRSKNVEPEPVGSVKEFPSVLGKRRRRKKKSCHQSRENKADNCMDKGCQTCTQLGDQHNELQDLTNMQNEISRVEDKLYCIHQLLPLLKQPNWEQILELEIEAKTQGKGLTGVQLQVVDCSNDDQIKCNFCRTLIMNLHRSCSKCYYKLCPSCCQEIRGLAREYANESEACKDVEGRPSESHSAPEPEGKCDSGNDSIPCPPTELGGCDDGTLNMKFLLPFGWIDKLDSEDQLASSGDSQGCMNTG